MITDAEFLHQKASNPTKPNIGKVYVQENALTRLGALCFIRRRLHHHEIAAAKFKNLYEARYGVGNPAIDPSIEPVDTSPIAHDAGMAARIDRTTKLDGLEDSLGKPSYDRLVALLVLCIPAGEGQRWRKRMVSVDQVLADLDALSELWGYSNVRAA